MQTSQGVILIDFVEYKIKFGFLKNQFQTSKTFQTYTNKYYFAFSGHLGDDFSLFIKGYVKREGQFV